MNLSRTITPTARRIISGPGILTRLPASPSQQARITISGGNALYRRRCAARSQSTMASPPPLSPSQPQAQPALQPAFSSGSDQAALEAALVPLLSAHGAGGRWTLAGEGHALERTFKFKTFAKTWDFMTAVSLQCKIKNHHPEWSNVFNTTFIRWTTHSPKGLSSKDVDLAAICDSLARDFGEIEQQDLTCRLPSLADKAVISSGDCCVPKTKK
ncbi:pterin 4 alpha carbinolamine dehydratase-domain-containing protein [Podospora appendiculata]|uniref:4a-hydroxytetrahydrobiopterin dehydratase n=1 Tax=Podospora appendiculata TaxID=314037 RepID=A0AAE1CBP5_9PEZI|nr:pterin 4 alpha carbinolamine dehydratase-domain-containing protein [Podospora appendiculata]